MANTSYAGAAAPRKLSLPKELLARQERCAANADWVLGSEQPLQKIKIGLCRQVCLSNDLQLLIVYLLGFVCWLWKLQECTAAGFWSVDRFRRR
jgi:hypothetical protein